MGKIREGRIAGTAKHRFVVTTVRDFAGHEHRLTSHAMMCQMHGHGSIPDYWNFYFSMPRHLVSESAPAEAAKGVSLEFAGLKPTWLGERFGHVQVPQGMKLIQRMLPTDNCYIGYDTMGMKDSPPVPFLWVSFIGFVERIQTHYLAEEWNRGN
jgi:hypothetical protein